MVSREAAGRVVPHTLHSCTQSGLHRASRRHQAYVTALHSSADHVSSVVPLAPAPALALHVWCGFDTAWAWLCGPPQDPLVPSRYPPDLQYLAAQQTPNTQPVINWSETHEATPKCGVADSQLGGRPRS